MKTFGKITSIAMGSIMTILGLSHAGHADPLSPGGWTIDIQLGAPLPEGVYFLNTAFYLDRPPKSNDLPNVNAVVNIPVLAWSTPATLFGGRLEVIGFAAELGVGINPGSTGSSWHRAFYNPAGLVGLAWDLGGGWSVANYVGGFIPVNTDIGRNVGLGGYFWTFSDLAAIAYNANGWSADANFIYSNSFKTIDTGVSDQPDTTQVDFSISKHIDKWQIGFVGYGSTDLNGASRNTDAFGGVHRQRQFALGGLVGYNFGPLIGQIYATRDIAEANYTGYDTRVFARLVIPLWNPPASPSPPVIAKY